jgi:hypothetical protein
MPVRLQDYHPDLLHRAAMSADRERLAPEVQETVVVLLKQLLSECVPGTV